MVGYAVSGFVDGFFKGRDWRDAKEDRKLDRERQARLDAMDAQAHDLRVQEFGLRKRDLDDAYSERERLKTVRAEEEAFHRGLAGTMPGVGVPGGMGIDPAMYPIGRPVDQPAQPMAQPTRPVAPMSPQLGFGALPSQAVSGGAGAAALAGGGGSDVLADSPLLIETPDGKFMATRPPRDASEQRALAEMAKAGRLVAADDASRRQRTIDSYAARTGNLPLRSGAAQPAPQAQPAPLAGGPGFEYTGRGGTLMDRGVAAASMNPARTAQPVPGVDSDAMALREELGWASGPMAAGPAFEDRGRNPKPVAPVQQATAPNGPAFEYSGRGGTLMDQAVSAAVRNPTPQGGLGAKVPNVPVETAIPIAADAPGRPGNFRERAAAMTANERSDQNAALMAQPVSRGAIQGAENRLQAAEAAYAAEPSGKTLQAVVEARKARDDLRGQMDAERKTMPRPVYQEQRGAFSLEGPESVARPTAPAQPNNPASGVEAAAAATPAAAASTEATKQAVGQVALSFGIQPGEKITPQQVKRASDSTVEWYYETAAPKMVQFYVGRGELDKAQAYIELIESRQGKLALQDRAAAAFKAINSDIDGWGKDILSSFKRYGYVDPTFDIDEDATGVVRDSGGNFVSAQLVFKDRKTGNTVAKTFNSESELIDYGMVMTDPATMVEYLMQPPPEAPKGAITQQDIFETGTRLYEGSMGQLTPEQAMAKSAAMAQQVSGGGLGAIGASQLGAGYDPRITGNVKGDLYRPE